MFKDGGYYPQHLGFKAFPNTAQQWIPAPSLSSYTAASLWKHNHQFASISFLCLPLPPASPPPPLCVLFTWLTCSLHAGSFVHQKAPAPGDCLLTFLSRALEMSVSTVSLSPLFFVFFFSTLMKRLPGWRAACANIRSARRPEACSSLEKSLNFITAFFWGVLCWDSLRERVSWEFRVLLKDISSCMTVDWHTAYYCRADPVNFQVQDIL